MEQNSSSISQSWQIVDDRGPNLEFRGVHNSWFSASPTNYIAIPSRLSILARLPFVSAYRDSFTTIFAWRCRKWTTFSQQKPYASKMDKFCCDSAAMCSKIGIPECSGVYTNQITRMVSSKAKSHVISYYSVCTLNFIYLYFIQLESVHSS